ncbi:tetratricopeptide repeat protein [Stutzerimonas stutzeri]|uniref:tetratricopeptide repeat protein n=1 Tax=Stutzerimonas stutzeri TaxID=316 RepID=UPI00265CA669|nr:tetratricopeptide repeat protein [Stutzerimonas stutzeri]MCF6783739.1 sel1 repeat family protein [Stutzerimonas stutzeri]
MTKRIYAWAAIGLLTGCTAKQSEPVSLPYMPYSASPVTASSLDISPEKDQAAQGITASELYESGMQSKEQHDYAGMLDALMAAAELDHAQACYELARLLTDGKIVVRDVVSAKVYLERSAELGNSEALRVLAWNYMRGEYGQVDLALGTTMMSQAAASSIRAQRELGMLYANIYQPNLNDPVQAERYLRLAAQASDAEAAYNLGRLKQASGEYLDAVSWYELATTNGHTKAAAALAALSEGRGEQTPLPQLVQHHAYAPEEMGTPALDRDDLYRQATQILLQGQRTLDQEAKAYALLSLASDMGHEIAAQELGFLKGVKTLMDRQNPNWLEEQKHRITSASDQ